MTAENRQHWERVYSSMSETEVSWFQEYPKLSLELITRAGAGTESAIVDIGGGASRLADTLLNESFRDVTVLDLSNAALATAKGRLGSRASMINWTVVDAANWQPERTYDIWHDRAAFHFLTRESDRDAYIDCLTRAVKIGGHAIIATFAPDGPERCSGLPVIRYDGQSLARTLGGGFTLIDSVRHAHRTPRGSEQKFQFSLFRRGSEPVSHVD